MTWNKNMDDAPRDGTPILAWCKNKGGQNNGYVETVYYSSGEYEAEGWTCGHRTRDYEELLMHEATHWMPLPLPPEV